MRKLMWFSIGFAVSCAVALYLLSGSILVWLALAFGIVSIAALFVRHDTVRAIALLLLGFSVGVLWMWGYDAVYLQPARDYDGKMIFAQIEASDYTSATDYGAMVDGKLTLNNKSYSVRLYLDDFRDIRPGDRISGVCSIGMTTPAGFEESDYYQGKGIFVIADADGAVLVEHVEKTPGRYIPTLLRKRISDFLENVFPADVLGLVRSLFLGDTSLLTYEENTALKVSGIRHIVAVSGLHVSILFAFVYTVAFRRRVSTALLGIPVLLLFAAIAGFTPSISRACIMQILMILALLFNKEYDPPTALAFSALVILAVNPMAITSVSFQLSVGCVVGIFVFSGRISTFLLNKFGHPTGRSIGARLARWVSSGAGVTLSAMVFTTPLSAYYFGAVSLVGVFTNLLTLWAVSAMFYGIVLTCLLGFLWLPLGKIVAWIISWLVRYVMLAAKLFASIPFAAVYTCSIYIALWIFLCYLLLAIFLFARKKQPVLLLAMMAVSLCVSVVASYVEPRIDDVRITVFDVGEGQSILVQSFDEYYLVDCGGTYNAGIADTVSQTLLSQGITTLNGVILTHYDGDHAGGILGLLSRIGTEKLYLPDLVDTGETKQLLIDNYSEQICWVQNETCLSWEHSKLTLLAAPANKKNKNESSLCILFQAVNYDILITGDRGSAGEKALLAAYDLPQLDLLVAGHHGSSSSTNFELLSHTLPAGVVISTGGTYGHPTEELLSRLDSFGCKVWRTDQSGTIIFRG